jgi:hypothetical protein
MELLSGIALRGTASVLTKGAIKYASHNWRKGMPWSRCIGSLMRHLTEYLNGVDYDYYPETCDGCKTNTCKDHTGELHIDQVICNTMFLQEYARTHKHLDDRFKISQAGEPKDEERK